MGEIDRALPAHLKATEFPDTAPRAIYNMACAYALKGDKDNAFEWLAKAEETGRVDMTQIEIDTDLESLRDDPRFRELLPKPEDFVEPFVEPVRVLQEWVGEAKGGEFGWIARNIGDVDGDGIDDITTSAPSLDVDGERAGRAYVLSGKDGELLLTLTGETDGDRFGSSGAGLFGEKHQFLVVGAPDAGPDSKGRTYVYSGTSGELSFTIDADESGSQLGGMFVSVVGDVDGDGVVDIYASDWSNNAKGQSTGRIYVHSGADGKRLLTLTGEESGDGFGIGPADAGDVDGDGHDDLIIGAWRHSGAAPAGGKVYLYSGKDGSLMHAYTCNVQGDTFGFDATGMGDVDGDGTIDFLVTSAWSAIGGARTGRMFIVSGEPTRAR
jgi:hypothetical protein